MAAVSLKGRAGKKKGQGGASFALGGQGDGMKPEESHSTLNVFDEVSSAPQGGNSLMGGFKIKRGPNGTSYSGGNLRPRGDPPYIRGNRWLMGKGASFLLQNAISWREKRRIVLCIERLEERHNPTRPHRLGKQTDRWTGNLSVAGATGQNKHEG